MKLTRQIFAYNLAEYTTQVIQAVSEGYGMSNTNEGYPVFVNNGFFALFEKEVEDVVEITEKVQVETTSEVAPTQEPEVKQEEPKRRGRRSTSA